MKKYFMVLFMLSVWLFGISSVKAVELNIDSKNAILYNLDENTILYEKASKEKISIASMTKIMTAIVALEHISNLEETTILTSADFYGLKEANASVAGFKIGQKVTYRDLLYGLLLPSGAEAAQALTRIVSGNKEKFVRLMNEKATALGLKNTHFMNETGLDETGHYSTVEEVAIFFQYALKNDEFKKMITASSYTISDKTLTLYSTIEKNKVRYGLNMNYLEGGKTGTTFDAGLCLASIAFSNDTHYMLVTARAPYNEGPKNMYDARTIYGYFIQNYGNKIIIEKGQTILTLNTKYTNEEEISFKAKETITKYLTNDFNQDDLEYIYQGEKIITSKIKSGTKLGTVTIKYQGEIFYEQDIILDQKVAFSLAKFLKAHLDIIFGGIIFILIVLGVLFQIKNKKSKKVLN